MASVREQYKRGKVQEFKSIWLQSSKLKGQKMVSDKQLGAILLVFSAIIFIIIMAVTNPQNRVLDRKASSKEPKVRNGSMTYNKMNERDMERMIDRIMKRVNATKTTKAPLNETEASSIKWAKQVREIRATKEESPLNKKIVDEKTKILFNEVQKSKNQNKPGYYEKNENARAGLKNLITKTHPHFKRFNHPQLLLATDHSKYERLIDLISIEEDKENSVENTERKNEVIGELFYFLVEEYNKKGDLLTAEQ